MAKNRTFGTCRRCILMAGLGGLVMSWLSACDQQAGFGNQSTLASQQNIRFSSTSSGTSREEQWIRERKLAGDSPIAIATSLKAQYQLDARTLALLMKAQGFECGDVAEVLHVVYSMPAEATASMLRSVEYDTVSVASALKSKLAIKIDESSLILSKIGCGTAEIAETLIKVFAADADRKSVV